MRRAIIPFILVGSVVACLDMDVVNPNDPTTDALLASPQDLEGLISTGFARWVSHEHGNMPNTGLSLIAGEFGSGFIEFGSVAYASGQPRGPIVVDPAAPFQHWVVPWFSWNELLAAQNTALRAIHEGGAAIVIDGKDQTPRARAFAKFLQGLSFGNLGLMYDQAVVQTENVDPERLDFIVEKDVQELLRPYPEVMDSAMARLQQAQALAQQHNVTIPSETPERWISGYSLSTADFVRLINTYKARFLVYQARNRQERDAVDWDRVVSLIDQGITEDFAPQAEPGIITSEHQQRAARMRTVIPSDWMRPDYETIGLADQSGKFQEWWETPWDDRQPFTMEGVQDRRIVGDPDEMTEGKYLGYDDAHNTIWSADRGTANRTWYYYHRLGAGESWRHGPLLTVTTDEMRLLKAEGLIRLGQSGSAVELINQSRVENGELDPVSVEGVPQDENGFCTPRKYNGECGSLWDALRWEKRMEGMGVVGAVVFYDRRGWQGLWENTAIHHPLPGLEQDLLGLGRYTFGGGMEGSAPAPDIERCPVPLPRCP